MNEYIFENDVCSFYIEDGILFGEYKVEKLNLKIAKEVVEARLYVSGGKNYPAFVDISKIKTVSKEARDYLSEGDPTKNISAAAIYASSLIAKMLVTFFLSFNKPKIPVKAFSNREDAINWLKKYTLYAAVCRAAKRAE